MTNQNYNKSLKVIILFSFLYAFICSINWLIPLIKYSESYLPIFRSIEINELTYTTAKDAYIYYAFIRDIVDGYLIYTDPLTLENKKYFSIYNTYNLSLLLASLPGIFTKEIPVIFMFNTFFFSFLNYFLVCIFVRYFIQSIIYVILITTFIFFFTQPLFFFSQFKDFLTLLLNLNFNDLINYSSIALRNSEIHRMPSLLVTNFHLFLTIFVIIKHFFNKKNLYLIIMLLGSSIYISIQNFLILYFFISSLFILNFNNLIYRNQIIKIALFSSIISIPGVMILLEEYLKINIPLIETNLDKFNVITNNIMFNENNSGYQKINQTILLKKLIKFTLIFSLLFFISSKYKKILLSIYLSVILPYIMITYYSGSQIGERIIFRGGELLLNSTMIIIIFIFLIKFNFLKKIILSKSLKIINSLLVFFIFLVVFLSQIYQDKNNYIYLNKDFKKMYKWINDNTDKEDTFITLDPILITNLPIYTKVNMYISQGLIGRSNVNDRMRRFIEISNFYGLKTDNVEIFQSNLKKLLNKEKGNIYQNTIKNYNHIIFSREKNYFLKYKDIFQVESDYLSLENNQSLNFSNDYIIISNFDKKLINFNSNINKFLEEPNLLYKNNSYSIFKIIKN